MIFNFSPRRSVRRRFSSGWTLPEMLVAVAVGGLVLAAVGKLTLFTARSFVAMGNYNDLDRASTFALDTMTRDIRMTRSLSSYATNKLVFVDQDTNTLTYQYFPSSRELHRIKGGSDKTLLKQCDYLFFEVSQRNPSNNFSFFPVTTNSTAKLVDVSWRCSRQIFGQKVNTESVQTAKIVIRN